MTSLSNNYLPLIKVESSSDFSIPFNKPFLTGKEAHYIYQAVYSGKLSGNGHFTRLCQKFFEDRYGFGKTLLTSSCTDALEMAAILCNIKPGDEVIVPSYTFVSSALAFVRQGARIVFADSMTSHPDIDAAKLESLITPDTKVIVPVHYAGVACDMDAIMDLANRHNILVVEDAAQAIDSFYKGRPLGSIGHLGCFSFHETKNIIAGEGGMLTINRSDLMRRAEIIWEKGTNRSEFFRGEVNKYGWVDTGSSFLPSEMTAAFLWAQIEHMEEIQRHRKELWETYRNALLPLEREGKLQLPHIPEYATNNAHMFYIVLNDIDTRSRLIHYLKEHGILSVFHYLSLHKSQFYISHPEHRPVSSSIPELPECDNYADCLLRLPMFYELTNNQAQYIANLIRQFFSSDNIH